MVDVNCQYCCPEDIDRECTVTGDYCFPEDYRECAIFLEKQQKRDCLIERCNRFNFPSIALKLHEELDLGNL